MDATDTRRCLEVRPKTLFEVQHVFEDLRTRSADTESASGVFPAERKRWGPARITHLFSAVPLLGALDELELVDFALALADEFVKLFVGPVVDQLVQRGRRSRVGRVPRRGRHGRQGRRIPPGGVVQL